MYKFKYQAICSAEYRKYTEDEEDKVIKSILSTKQTTNLTKLQLNYLNVRDELDTRFQNVEMRKVQDGTFTR